MLAAYLVYAVGTLFELRLDSPVRARIALIADTAFFGFWMWVVASGWVGWPSAGWISALLCGYVLVSAVLLHDVLRVVGVAVVVAFLAFLFAPRGEMPLVWVSLAAGAVGVALSVEKRYLNRRLSHTLRHNVVIRSQAQGAREAERQRIAADFHDGPLQSFISFQMRLEIVKKLLARDVAAAADELRQLQELVQGSRWASCAASSAACARPRRASACPPRSAAWSTSSSAKPASPRPSLRGELHDPAETEVSLELLQIVRETLNNIHKHSGATRMALSVGMFDHKVEIKAEDNGSGFPVQRRL